MTTQLSPAAEALIVTFEVGSKSEYNSHPTWSGGASGVTIGIGCDLGYWGPVQVGTVWGPYLSAGVVKRLQQVAGIKGASARPAAQALADIVVPWEAACAVFDATDMPDAITQTRAAFPGVADLPADCFGALASVVFNRGSQITSSDPAQALRRIEMAQIRDAIAEARARDVPAYLRAMKRLWPAGSGEDGLRTRRDAEAALFERGLAAS